MSATLQIDSPANQLDVDKINPKLNPAYSPNLWKYMKGQRSFAKYIHAYRHKMDGDIWLGFWDDGWFTSAKLVDVLCNGKRAHEGAWANIRPTDTELMPDFWEGYLKLGRCHIDPEHAMHFIDDRWSIVGKVRQCLWCGHIQHLHTVEKIVHENTWKHEPQGEA